MNDRYGKQIEPGDWFIRLDQNNEGRLYLVLEFPENGKVRVHEYRHRYENCLCTGQAKSIYPVRLTQIIKIPTPVIWYPKALLPEVVYE